MANYKLSDIENEMANTFKELHKKCRPKGREVYAPYSYIFTPTGIGVAVKIVCPYCGENKDITDVGCW